MQTPFNFEHVATHSEIEAFNLKVLKVKNKVLFIEASLGLFLFILALYISLFGILFVTVVIGMVATHIYYINLTAYELDNSFYMPLYNLCAKTPETQEYMRKIKSSGRYFTNYEYHMIKYHIEPEYDGSDSTLIS